MLGDFRSQIKYSSAPFTDRLRGQWYRWRITQLQTGTATLTSSTWNTTTMACGSTTNGLSLTTSGMLTMSLCSVFESISFPCYNERFFLRIIKIFLPATVHFTCFIEFSRQFFILVIRYDLAFPCNGNNEFECLQGQDTLRDFFFLFIFIVKIGYV